MTQVTMESHATMESQVAVLRLRRKWKPSETGRAHACSRWCWTIHTIYVHSLHQWISIAMSSAQGVYGGLYHILIRTSPHPAAKLALLGVWRIWPTYSWHLGKARLLKMPFRQGIWAQTIIILTIHHDLTRSKWTSSQLHFFLWSTLTGSRLGFTTFC